MRLFKHVSVVRSGRLFQLVPWLPADRSLRFWGLTVGWLGIGVIVAQKEVRHGS